MKLIVFFELIITVNNLIILLKLRDYEQSNIWMSMNYLWFTNYFENLLFVFTFLIVVHQSRWSWYDDNLGVCLRINVEWWVLNLNWRTKSANCRYFNTQTTINYNYVDDFSTLRAYQVPVVWLQLFWVILKRSGWSHLLNDKSICTWFAVINFP